LGKALIKKRTIFDETKEKLEVQKMKKGGRFLRGGEERAPRHVGVDRVDQEGTSLPSTALGPRRGEEPWTRERERPGRRSGEKGVDLADRGRGRQTAS